MFCTGDVRSHQCWHLLMMMNPAAAAATASNLLMMMTSLVTSPMAMVRLYYNDWYDWEEVFNSVLVSVLPVNDPQLYVQSLKVDIATTVRSTNPTFQRRSKNFSRSYCKQYDRLLASHCLSVCLWCCNAMHCSVQGRCRGLKVVPSCSLEATSYSSDTSNTALSEKAAWKHSDQLKEF